MTDTIIGNYRIAERIARGGMGVVYRGSHLTLPREVAIKSIAASSHSDLRGLRDRFEKEAFIQSQLDHPGIVKIYDYMVSAQTYYIVMEFVEGRSLAQLLEHEVSPLPVERALMLFEQMLAAIAYAQEFVYQDQIGVPHKGLIHRDLKPANILITPRDRIKITDFGIVKLVGSEKTLSGGNYGSPEYVSPEQADGSTVDPRSDIYSLGIILYEMLTGHPPFHSHGNKLSQLEIVRAQIKQAPQPPSEINTQISSELEAVILRSLEKQPDKRFASAEEFLRALRGLPGRERFQTEPGEQAARVIQIRVGTDEIITPTIPEASDRSYVTQRVPTQNCPACGTKPDANDIHCSQCGRDLTGSRSTVELTQKELSEWRRTRAIALWVGVGAALVALAGILIYVASSR